jgi:hypothetical protein
MSRLHILSNVAQIIVSRLRARVHLCLHSWQIWLGGGAIADAVSTLVTVFDRPRVAANR